MASELLRRLAVHGFTISGPGIFRAFHQGDADRSGLGLGLAIARESVEGSGGVIRARSVPGEGCIFTVDLPRFAQGPATVGGNALSVARPALAR